MGKWRAEKVDVCEGCGHTMLLSPYRDKMLCRNCMIGDEIPPQLEDHMSGHGPLGDESRMDSSLDRSDLGWRSPLARAVDAALKRLGLDISAGEVMNNAARSGLEMHSIKRADAEAGFKLCSKCGERKPVDSFYPVTHHTAAHSWHNRQGECKRCRIKRSAKGYADNRDAARATQMARWDAEGEAI